MKDRKKPSLCTRCGEEAKYIMSFNSTDTVSEYPTWIRGKHGTLQVVDKEGDKHCQMFLKDPSRKNFENWKRVEGVRILEKGEKIEKKKFDTKAHAEKILKMRQERNRYVLRDYGRGV